MERQVLGIDFGTSFSSVAVLYQKKITVIEDETGSAYIPSVVCFRDKEKVGITADHFKKRYPTNTVYEIKRVVGCRYDDEVVRRQMAIWPFKVVEGRDHRVQVELTVNDKTRRYYPEFIISKILKYLVQLAEQKTGEKYSKAIITVPANFNDTQRKCMRVAARFANLDVLRILDEPVAAAVAISIDTNIDNSRVLVYDLGGGTFDFTILEVTINDFCVIATDGDPNLGGADFTNALTNYAIDLIQKDTGINAKEHPRLEVELRSACEIIKQELSSATTAQLDLDLSRFDGEQYTRTITREEFESVIRESIERSVHIVKSCLDTYHIDIATVSGIALVGGSSTIPLIQTELKRVYPSLRVLSGYDARQVVCRGALVQALSIISEENQNAEPIPVPIAPQPVVVEEKDAPPAIEASLQGPINFALQRPSAMFSNAPIPPPPTSIPPPPPSRASFAAPPLPTSIPPVAMRTPVAPVASSAPAALASDAPIQPPIPLSFAQGDEEIHPVVSVVSGRPSIPPPPIPSPADSQPGSPLVIPVPSIPSPPASPLVAPLEVPPIPALENPSVIETSNGERDFSRIKIRSTTPLDLGIRVKGNQMSVIIPRNSPLPVEKSRYYKTNKDHPECLRCCIYQGNNSNVKYNSKIGIVNAYDLPVYEGVQNEIRVCFTIDIGGELHVHANLVGCEAEVKVEMLESVVLKKNEIETILEEETRTEQEILEEKKDELCSAIEFQIQDLESRDGGHFSALIAKEQEWLSNNRDTASVDDLMECLNRLRVWRVCWIRVQETGHGTHSFRWLENAFAMCIMSSRSWSRTLFSFASHTISRLFFGFCRF